MEDRTRRLNGLVRITRFWRDLSFGSDKTEAFNQHKAFGFWIGLFSDPYLRSWILGFDWKSISQDSSTSGAIAFFRRVYSVTLHDKLHSCGIRRTLNAETLPWIERSQLRWFVYVSGSQPFSDHVPLQHWQMNMYAKKFLWQNILAWLIVDIFSNRHITAFENNIHWYMCK